MSFGCPGGTPVLSPAPTLRSDREVIDAIAALIRSTGRFDEAIVDTPDGLDQAVARDGVLALVTLGGSTMQHDVSYRRFLRTVEFHVVLKARARDDMEGRELLGQLENEVCQALSGGDYTTDCLPEKGAIMRGVFDPTTRPNYLTGLTGVFAYVVSPSRPMEIAP